VTVTPQRNDRSAFFAALPVRAIGDKKITGNHFRVLSAVAWHDRISGPREKGAGCWASNKTLAQKCGIHYTDLSTALCDLVRWGYITRESHPMNGKLHVFRVVYGDLPDNNTPANVAPETKNHPEAADIICPENSEAQGKQGANHIEYIPQKREKIAHKRKESSAEAARRHDGSKRRTREKGNDGAYLAMVERELRAEAKSYLDPVDRRAVTEILNGRESEDPLYHQAERILERWGQRA
jgi:DNA-binding MarR family transcriptional regulator